MATELTDSFGRVHRDLRISVTDRCNFRCQYCMPEEGMSWMPRSELLSFEEIAKLAKLLVDRYSFDSIRLTGGEPTVRAHLPRLIEMLTPLGIDLALTTNGATLRLVANDLASAGLTRINISLDSLRADRFHELTRRNDLDKVLDGIAAAQEAGLSPVKINVVLMNGINDDEVLDFANWGRENDLIIRFIEFMPLDAQDEWSNARVVPYEQIRQTIAAVHPIEPLTRGSSPAERFRYVDGKGEIGIIASVTQSFCGTCDRIRLTADGQLRTCLFATEDHDLRSMVRSGASDDDIAQAVERAVAGKWAGHEINTVHFIRPNRSMSQIGG